MKPNYITLAEDVPEPVNYVVHAMITWAEAFLFAFFAALGLTAIVTCAKNGTHSNYSRHFWKAGDTRPSQALDFRMWNWGTVNKSVILSRLVQTLNRLVPSGTFCIILHPSHFHLEWNPPGVTPNVIGFHAGVYFYVSKT